MCKCAFVMLSVGFRESTKSKTQVQLWYNRFKEGREDFDEDIHPGHSSTPTTCESIEAVKKIILDNCRVTIKEIASDVGISFGSCHAILTDVLGMKFVAAKIVPKLLNFEQKLRCMDIAQEMLTTIQICSKRS